MKFQKRTLRICVPRDQWDIERDTPWGVMTYIDYREKTEFGSDEFKVIDAYAREKGMTWFASCWDEPSVDFMEEFDTPCHKIASALVTNDALLRKIASTGRPVIMSTGMSTMEQIRHAVEILESDNFMLAHCTSSYPAAYDELNLRMLDTLADEFDCPIGYSGHEVGLSTTIASVALGATFVERHVTLSRAMWGRRPGGFCRTPGNDPACTRHPAHRGRTRRRREEGLRQRTADHRQTAGKLAGQARRQQAIRQFSHRPPSTIFS